MTQPQNLGPGNIWFAIAFVLVMMVVAALVSAAADRMGHRAARRKLRIGKLRPRHVSTLIAIISGMVISLATVLVLFLVWHDFYNALTQYDNLNGKLAQVQQETKHAEQDRDKAIADKQQAEKDLTEARGLIANQSIEIRQKVGQIAEARNKLSGAQAELGKSRGKLAELRRSAERVERQLATKQAEYARVNRELENQQKAGQFYNEQQTAVREQIRGEITALEDQLKGLEAQIARSETGRTLLSVGDQLGYVEVKGGSAGLESALQSKLAEIKANIEARGLEFDPGSRDKVLEFIGAFPADSGDYLVRILSAENVFEGDRVLLDFGYERLGTLVPAGTAILDITIGDKTATISGLSGVRSEISVPAQFNGESLADLAVEAESVFQRGARRAGFVPQSGDEIASPVIKLTQVADDLIERARPVRIQFVTKRGASALEGEVLADAEVHVTGPMRRAAPEQPEEAPTPDSNSDAQPTEPEPVPAPDEDGNPG